MAVIETYSRRTTDSQPFWRSLPVVAAIICTLFFLQWADRDWMFGRFDASAHAGLAIAYAETGHIENRFSVATDADRPVAAFLPAMVDGTLIGQPSFRSLHWLHTGYAAVVLFLVAFLLRRHALPPGSIRIAPAAIVTALAVLFVAWVLSRFIGRPEILLILLATAGAFLFLRLRGLARSAFAGLFIGLFLVSHTTAAGLAAACFVGWLGWAPARPSAIQHAAIAAAVAIVTVALALAWYPGSIADWWREVAGMLAATDAAAVDAHSPTVWILSPFEGVAGSVLILVAATAISAALRNRESIRRRRWVVLGAAGAVLTLWFALFHRGFNPATVEWLAAAGIIVPLHFLAGVQAQRLHLVLSLAMIVVLAPGTFALVREQVVREAAHQVGPEPGELRQKLAALSRLHPDGGALSVQLLHLAPPEGRIVLSHRNLDQLAERDDLNYLVVAQTELTSLTPPELPGWRLAENEFLPEPIRIAGLTFSLDTPSHAYAVYLRDEP